VIVKSKRRDVAASTRRFVAANMRSVVATTVRSVVGTTMKTVVGTTGVGQRTARSVVVTNKRSVIVVKSRSVISTAGVTLRIVRSVVIKNTSSAIVVTLTCHDAVRSVATASSIIRRRLDTARRGAEIPTASKTLLLPLLGGTVGKSRMRNYDHTPKWTTSRQPSRKTRRPACPSLKKENQASRDQQSSHSTC
jgi:hypothetical protein